MTGENILKFANKAPENIFLNPGKEVAMLTASPRTALCTNEEVSLGWATPGLGATATGLRRFQETDRERS